MPTEITIWDDNSRTVSTGWDERGYNERNYDTPLPSDLEELMLDIARGKHPDWQSFANEMAEDETVIERVLQNRKGTR